VSVEPEYRPVGPVLSDERAVPPNDWELVRRTRAGDREAFRELVERYQRRVAALAIGMLRNRDDALDVVQETFSKAYQNLDRFKGDAGFYTWLYRIAFNVCVDHQRRDAKLPQLSLDDDAGAPEPVPDLGEAAHDEPFAQARSAEIGRRVQEAIRELTPDHRAVIVLREVEGLSYEEISRVLECPKGTVMSRLHYARRQLQARLRELL
jgi:RNA polymerase sigma-70 factor (ECF subfamily)